MFRLFDTFLIGLCLLCINLAVVVVGTMTGWLPGILRWVRALVRNFLFHSYQAYNRLFSWLAPLSVDFCGIDVTRGWARVAASSLVSILISGLIVLAMSWSYPYWLLAIATLHGVTVGIRWERLDRSAGFRLGVDL